MKCFYHSSDLDGICSGAIIKQEFEDCEIIPINYNQEFPWDTIDKDEIVYMVDFCLQPFSNMIRLNDMCGLIWIDHHISAIKSEKEADIKIAGLRRDGIGACFLVWQYIHDKNTIPYSVRLLAEYDVWNHNDLNTLPFQYGLRLLNLTPESALWPLIFIDDDIKKIIKQGQTILKYEKQYNERYARACSFEIEFEDKNCIVINKMINNSTLFDTVYNPCQHDIMISFGWMRDKWVVSLYSDKDNIDVSEIAKNRGGGGHKGAAGFTCDELPFELK